MNPVILMLKIEILKPFELLAHDYFSFESLFPCDVFLVDQLKVRVLSPIISVLNVERVLEQIAGSSDFIVLRELFMSEHCSPSRHSQIRHVLLMI